MSWPFLRSRKVCSQLRLLTVEQFDLSVILAAQDQAMAYRTVNATDEPSSGE